MTLANSVNKGIPRSFLRVVPFGEIAGVLPIRDLKRLFRYCFENECFDTEAPNRYGIRFDVRGGAINVWHGDREKDVVLVTLGEFWFREGIRSDDPPFGKGQDTTPLWSEEFATQFFNDVIKDALEQFKEVLVVHW